MYCYALVIAYDGTNYSGWQIQPNATSIQQILQDALSLIFRSPIYPVASGRTDAGVHATGQVVHFKAEREIDPRKLFIMLNGTLPKDIRVKKALFVPPEFHSRFSATSKLYSYYLHLDPSLDPHIRLYRTHAWTGIDIEQMKAAAACFIGTHDFSALANDNQKGSAAKQPIKTIYSITFHPIEGGIRIDFHGDGFLYKMVRNMVGVMLACGYKKLSVDAISELLASKDRKKAPMPAPAQGLFLTRVYYESFDI